MQGSFDQPLKNDLKRLIISECDLDLSPEEIDDDAPLFGPDADLGLDSIDGLQISVALQKAYGVRITDSKKLRKIMLSINTLANHLQPA